MQGYRLKNFGEIFVQKPSIWVLFGNWNTCSVLGHWTTYAFQIPNGMLVA